MPGATASLHNVFRCSPTDLGNTSGLAVVRTDMKELFVYRCVRLMAHLSAATAILLTAAGMPIHAIAPVIGGALLGLVGTPDLDRRVREASTARRVDVVLLVAALATSSAIVGALIPTIAGPLVGLAARGIQQLCAPLLLGPPRR